MSVEFFTELAASEELNEYKLLIDSLLKRYPDNVDDVLDFLGGMLTAMYQNPERAVWQAETMKYAIISLNAATVLNSGKMNPFIEFINSISKGDKPIK